jgi:hypothetical protein
MDYKEFTILLTLYILFFLWIYWIKLKKLYTVIGILFLLFTTVYFNRLELKDKVVYKNDTYYLYQDWFKSTEYFLNQKERSFADNYYVIRKHKHLICKFKYNFGYTEGNYPFPVISIKNDSILEINTLRSKILRIEIPINKNDITQDDIIVIYDNNILPENEKRKFIEITHT